MKKNLLLLFILPALGIFSSCKDDELVNGNGSAASGDEIQFAVSQAPMEFNGESTPSARVHYGTPETDENGKKTAYPVYWGTWGENGSVTPDEIAILCPQAYGDSYEDRECTYVINTSGDDTNTGSLSIATGDAGLKWGYNNDLHDFYALYPASMKANVVASSNLVTCNLPILQAPAYIREIENEDGSKEYIAEPNMDYAYMYAHGQGYKSKNDKIHLEFKPLVTTLEITVNGPDKNGQYKDETLYVSQVMVRSNQNISGDFNIKIADINDTENDGHTTSVDNGTVDKLVNIPVYRTNTEGNQEPIPLRAGDKLIVRAFLLPYSDVTKSATSVTVNMVGNGSKTKVLETADLEKHKINITSLPALEPTNFYYWMSAIDENVYFSQLSIPGTHNSFNYPNDAKSETVEGSDKGTSTPGNVMGSETIMGNYQTYDILGQMRKGARAFSLLVNLSGNVVAGETSQGSLNSVISEFWNNLKNCYTNDPYKLKRTNNEFLVLFIDFMQEGPDKNSDCHTWIKAVDTQIEAVKEAQFVTSLSNSTTLADLRNKLVIFVNYQGTTYPTDYDPDTKTKYIVLNKVYSDDTDSSECTNTFYTLNDRDITNIYRFVPQGAGFTNGSSVNVWKQGLQRLEPLNSISTITARENGKNVNIWPNWFNSATPNRIETKKEKIVKMIQQAVNQYSDGTSGQWNINNLGCFRIVDDRNFSGNEQYASTRETRGVSGNTVTAANVINGYTYNYLVNDKNSTGPLGVMQMNFFGMEQMNDASGTLDIYGVLLPQIIIENNFRFPLKTKGSSESTTSLRYDATFK